MIKIEKRHLKFKKLNVFTALSNAQGIVSKNKLLNIFDFFKTDVILFTTGYSFMFILWVLLNKRCVYYFWGFGDSGYLKTLIKKFIIGKCSIIVNHQDHLTYWKKSKNHICLLPMWIDTNYLDQFNSLVNDGKYYFVPGSNSRSLSLVNKLIDRGFDVRVAAKNNLDGVKSINYKNLSDEAFLSYFAKSKAILLPVNNDGHLPGQTTALEALYLKKLVFINRSTTSDLLSGKLIIIIDNKIESWEKAILKNDQIDKFDEETIDYNMVLHKHMKFIKKIKLG